MGRHTPLHTQAVIDTAIKITSVFEAKRKSLKKAIGSFDLSFILERILHLFGSIISLVRHKSQFKRMNLIFP